MQMLLDNERANQLRAGRRLEYFTLAWNLGEAVVAVAAGLFAGSIALIGFGADSLVESLSGGILLWRLQSHTGYESREQLARKLVAISFFGLALYVATDAGMTLLRHEAPERSVVGIILAVVSIVVMPLLARAKRRVATHLNSRALHADSRQTDICAYLSVILLIGLVLNAVLGWWWADPVSALAMVPIIAKEGVEAYRGDKCDECG
jgi:divalent metal cation (Fe/Co/Zn/Cd) transporter